MTNKHKKSIATPIEVDGYQLCWRLQRQPAWGDRDGYKGLALSVTRTDAVRRELILEYPYLGRPNSPGYLPERPKVSQKEIEADIRLAMEAGWDPDSRGRYFAFQVPRESK